MSKKKFTAGLESLFGETSEDLFPERDAPSTEKGKKERKRHSDGADRPASGKDFTSDLQSFLESSFEESLERQLKHSDQKSSHKTSGAKRTARPTGLDALIQRTVDESARNPRSPHQGLGKRITLLLNQDKLDKLKEIARQERTYLRNIIDDIVAEYIEAYEQSKEQQE